ncbi:MAG: hypothetical protein HQ483_18370 [Rhodospirillales bacterium]|nr:hypothetical protein [Rhodospirillales bacterium]
MASTRLSDVIVPEVFHRYIVEKTAELSALFQSQLIAADPMLSASLSGGGRTFNVPFWNDLGNTDSNISDDDPASDAVPLKVGASRDIAIRHNRNQSWSAMDLTAQLAGDDPMKLIGDRVAAYWARDMQRTAIATLNGILADNIANDSSDMLHSVSADAVSLLATHQVSATAVLDACQTMGDSLQDLAAIAMHSKVYTNLRKQNLIDFIPAARGEVNFPQYMGLTVIIDDNLPTTAGTNQTRYTTVLFAPGAFAFGEGAPQVPVETDRNPLAGDGGGEEFIVSRREFAIHPRGIKWTDASCAGQSPTNAEVAAATNWDRVYERKNVKMVFLHTDEA